MNLSDQTQRQILGIIFMAFLIAGILYGTTYQQFRHFDLSDPRGIADAHGYIEMAQGNFEVDPLHRYRPVVPWLVDAVSTVIGHLFSEWADSKLLSFYIVNFLFFVAAALFLFYFLINVTGSVLLSFIGLMIFLGSRHTIIASATPVIDSFYLCSISAFAWLVVTRRFLILALTIPLMACSKEIMIPILFLPLAAKEFRRWEYVLGLVAALATVWAMRYGVNALYADQIAHYKSIAYASDGDRGFMFEMGEIAVVAWNGLLNQGPKFFTLRELHNWQNGFAFAFLLSIAGIIISIRRKLSGIALPVLLILPLSFAYALVNENSGRLLFSAFPTIIAFALIAVREVLNRVSLKSQQ